MTSCEEPYIGDESIIRPPASTQLRITSAQASRATGSSPTLKVIQLPRPMTGSDSPLDGIGRVMIEVPWECAGAAPTATYALAAASAPKARRRVQCVGALRFIRSKLTRLARGRSSPYEHGDIPPLGS